MRHKRPTWGALKPAEAPVVVPADIIKPACPPGRRIGAIFLPYWPTDRLRRKALRDLPAERPLALAAQDGSRRVLMAVDHAAEGVGIRPGMPVGHALALVPDLKIVPADPVGDAADLARLAGWCLRFGPVIATAAPDGLWLDATGLAHLYGDEAGLVAAVVTAFAAIGVTARVALADTAGAAHAAARFTGQTIVPPGETADFMAGLPVAALRLPPGTAEDLRRLGIARVAHLARLPRGSVTLRFGAAVGRRLDQALGHLAEPLDAVTPAEHPQAERVFADPVTDISALAATIRPLTDAVCRLLAERHLGARRLDLLCRRVDNRIAALRVGTARPSRAPEHLARLLTERLDAIDPGFGIERVSLLATLTETLAPTQLAECRGGGSPADLGELVDRLANRPDVRQLYRWAPVESDLPERAVRRVEPLASTGTARWPAELPRPIRLLQPPEPVEVTSLLPDHPPLMFVWRRMRHHIVRADGPERLFGEWWRGPDEIALTRDYFRVEDASGSRFWLYREGEPGVGRWFLHGIFG